MYLLQEKLSFWICGKRNSLIIEKDNIVILLLFYVEVFAAHNKDFLLSQNKIKKKKRYINHLHKHKIM